MKFQLQLNRYSCLATSFAMVADYPILELIQGLGHDGSEIIIDDVRRGHHPQEILDYFFKLGKYVIEIDPVIIQKCGDHIYEPSTNPKRIENYLLTHNAVLSGTAMSGKRHAVAWSHEDQLIFDPSGQKYHLCLFNIETIFLLKGY